MNKIKPSFRKSLWIMRVSLFFLFPPLFFPEYIVGGLTCSLFGGLFDGPFSIPIGYIIIVCSAFCFAMGVYTSTTYEIRPTEVRYSLHFFLSKRKDILLTNVKEIELKIGFLQKFYGLGTIVIHTQASLAGNNKTGLSLFDIENPDKIYTLLKENLSKASRVTEPNALPCESY